MTWDGVCMYDDFYRSYFGIGIPPNIPDVACRCQHMRSGHHTPSMICQDQVCSCMEFVEGPASIPCPSMPGQHYPDGDVCPLCRDSGWLEVET